MSSQLIDFDLEPALPPEFEAVRRCYAEIYTIVAPPRCSSTALARIFWEHPSIACYCHEPFEIAYFRQAPLSEVAQKLLQPLDLAPLTKCAPAANARSLVVKEMPYQVGSDFPLLSALATAPIVFLVRDPRLNIASRMEKKEEVGDDSFFPLVETGWELVQTQVEYCRHHDVEHLIVSAEDFRNRPLEILPDVFARLGLSFSEAMLSWRACGTWISTTWRATTATSTPPCCRAPGSTAETDKPPPLDWFPVEEGFRDHVAACLEIYRALLESPARLRPERRRSAPATRRLIRIGR